MNKNLKERLQVFTDNLYTIAALNGSGVSEVHEDVYDYLVDTYKLKDGNIHKTYGFEFLKSLCTKNKDIDEIEEEVLRKKFIDKVKSKLKNTEFTPSNITHDSICGFKKIEDLIPFLKKLINDGCLVQKYNGKYSLAENSTEDTFNDDDLSEEYRQNLEEEIKGYKRFVITTAVAKKPVHEPFLNAIQNYAHRNNALVLVLPSDIRNTNNQKESEDGKDEKSITLDPKLKKFRVVFKDLMLNNNLCVCSIKTSAKQINTLTGLDRVVAKKDASIIVASTKHFLKYIPNRHYDIPKALATTGAITLANYDTDRYMSKRTAYIAGNDHIYGAVIVEIENENIFHLRHTVASCDGSFTDLGVEYNPDGSIKILSGSILVEGDSHTESIDLDLHKETMRFAKEMNVDTIVLHDVFNAASITHHDNEKNLTRAIKAMHHRLSLKDECMCLKDYLEEINNCVNNIVIVNSNHDRHLEKWLESGKYIKDPVNSYYGHLLALSVMQGKNPLKVMIEDELGLKSKDIIWLNEDESYEKYNVEFGVHGDRGSNGAKGSLRCFENGVWNCVTAHTHSAQIIRNAYSVGTIAKMDQGYNKGFSSWTRTCCICYPNGVKQLINFIPNDKGGYSWRLK